MDKEWLVDVRETKKYIDAFTEYITSYGYSVKVVKLDAGDYVYKDVAFERKKDDFLTFKRVIEQSMLLKKMYNYPYLIVEKDLTYYQAIAGTYYHKDIRNHILGLVASLCVRGVAPVFCGNMDNMFYIMRRIAEKHYDGKNRDIEVYTRNRVNIGGDSEEDVLTNMLLGINGLGVKYAKAVANEYKNMASLVFATVEDLVRIEGIGEKRAKKILKSLGMEVLE